MLGIKYRDIGRVKVNLKNNINIIINYINNFLFDKLRKRRCYC